MLQPVDPRQVRLHGVLVTYRRPKELDDTLTRLSQQTRRLDSLVVVDNDPSEGAHDCVLRHPSVSYLPAGDNLGPAGALSIGLSSALSDADDDDWLVLFDDDDPPQRTDELERLLTFAFAASARSEDVGAVGLVGARFSTLSGRVLRVNDEALEGDVQVDYIGGGQFPAYKVSALREIGGPRADLFFGFDDLEFGLRLRSAGWRLVVDGERWKELRRLHNRTSLSPSSIRATSAPPAWRAYYSTRNQIVIARAHGSLVAPLCATVLASLRIGRALITPSRRPAAATMAKGVSDAWRGRLGRRVEPVAKINESDAPPSTAGTG